MGSLLMAGAFLRRCKDFCPGSSSPEGSKASAPRCRDFARDWAEVPVADGWAGAGALESAIYDTGGTSDGGVLCRGGNNLRTSSLASCSRPARCALAYCSELSDGLSRAVWNCLVTDTSRWLWMRRIKVLNKRQVLRAGLEVKVGTAGWLAIIHCALVHGDSLLR